MRILCIRRKLSQILYYHRLSIDTSSYPENSSVAIVKVYRIELNIYPITPIFDAHKISYSEDLGIETTELIQTLFAYRSRPKRSLLEASETRHKLSLSFVA